MASGGGGSAKISSGALKGKVMYLSEGEIVALGKKAGIGYAEAFSAMKTGDNAKVNALLAKVAASGTKNVKDSLGDTLAAKQASSAADANAKIAASYNDKLPKNLKDAGVAVVANENGTFSITDPNGETLTFSGDGYVDSYLSNGIQIKKNAYKDLGTYQSATLNKKLDQALGPTQPFGVEYDPESEKFVMKGSSGQTTPLTYEQAKMVTDGLVKIHEGTQQKADELDAQIDPSLKKQGYEVKPNYDGTFTLYDNVGPAFTGPADQLPAYISGANENLAPKSKPKKQSLATKAMLDNLNSQLVPGLKNSGYKVTQTGTTSTGKPLFTLEDGDGSPYSSGPALTMQNSIKYLNTLSPPSAPKGASQQDQAASLTGLLSPTLQTAGYKVTANDNGSYSIIDKYGDEMFTGDADYIASTIDKSAATAKKASPIVDIPSSSSLNAQIHSDFKDDWSVEQNDDGTFSVKFQGDAAAMGTAAVVQTYMKNIGLDQPKPPTTPALSASALSAPTSGTVTYQNKNGKQVTGDGQVQGQLASIATPFGEAVIHQPSGKAIAYVKKGEGQAAMEQLNQSGQDWDFASYDALSPDQQLAAYNAVQGLKQVNSKASIPGYALTGAFDPSSVTTSPPKAPKATKAPKGKAGPFATSAESKQIISLQKKAKANEEEDYDSGNLGKIEQALVRAFQAANGGKTINTDANAALLDYQGSGYNAMNAKLWQTSRTSNYGLDVSGSSMGPIKSLMNYMKTAVAPFDMQMLRTVPSYHPAHSQVRDMEIGQTYHQKGFDSTTANPNGVKGNEPDGLWVTYRVPQGSKGVYLNGVPGFDSSIPSEQEWLSPANSYWKLVEKKVYPNGKVEAIMELVAQYDFEGSSLWP